ncbi:LysR family transcriptional regulator [Rhizobium paknamense]|uniref:DNA-binding transcriptional LysR family regulator n=1 Tax=Rhizobium paknamense TaxID=1206817 RepID=A0ABU0IGQ0_9HYPH|nr:LysR family transcriptional regulator [Rhizobium paknamense]MDQ0457409.1 DNA-binding transcriptional LysR family regulator [Rhizobium paknamense]
MNDYRALKIFLAAAETLNFAQVARGIGMTPAAVTRAIAALEEDLGVQLFVRTTRQVSLTTEGAVFAAQITPAIKALDGARQELMNTHKADQGRLRISAPTWFGKTMLPPILADFARQFPRISFEISLSDGLIDILEGDYDLTIRISSTPSDKFTIWRKICRIKRILVAAPNSRFPTVDHPGDLKPEDCLAYSSESRRESWQLSDGHATVTLPAGAAFSSNQGDLLAEMAAESFGVALLPEFHVARQIAEGRLVQILPGWSPPDLWLTLYYPPYQALPPRIASFSRFLETAVNKALFSLETGSG